MTIHPRTRAALEVLASRPEWLSVADDHVRIDDGYRWAATAHRLDNGRWIVARYDRQSAQWRSGDMRHPDPGFGYAYAATLEGLAAYGVRTYRSPVEALRANLG